MKLIATATLAGLLLTSCIRVSVNGPGTEATVTITDQDGNVVFEGETVTLEQMATSFGPDWMKFTDEERLLLAGAAYLDPKKLTPGVFYLVESSGGQDIDVDKDNVPDETPTAIKNSLASWVQGLDVARSRANANAWTTLSSRCLEKYVKKRLSFDPNIYNWCSRLLIQEDVNGDNVVNYRDALAFNFANDDPSSDLGASPELLKKYEQLTGIIRDGSPEEVEAAVTTLTGSSSILPFYIKAEMTTGPGTISCSDGTQSTVPREVTNLSLQTDGSSFFRLNAPPIPAPDDVTITARRPFSALNVSGDAGGTTFKSGYNFDSPTGDGSFEFTAHFENFSVLARITDALGNFALVRLQSDGTQEIVTCTGEGPAELRFN